MSQPVAPFSLVADVGGTHSRLALIDADGRLSAVETFVNRAHDSWDELLAAYLDRTAARPARAALAIAGPVSDNEVHMTNLGWTLSATGLAREFGIERVDLMNDFAAQAWATEALSTDQLLQVGGGNALPVANRAVLGPGTGLGVSGLIATPRGWAEVAGEGGHVSMAAMTPEEAELIAAVGEEFGHCSAERLLSGPGLATIYAFLDRAAESVAPEQVTELAAAGDGTARAAIEMFCRLLGTVAADLALTFGARGGVYLAGGILPVIREPFALSGFRERFETKGRFSAYLAGIPTFLVTAPDPALQGLAYYVRNVNHV